MMILEAVLLIVVMYVLAGLAYYAYCVFISWSLLGFWKFDISETHIGICRYPRWLLFWLERIG